MPERLFVQLDDDPTAGPQSGTGGAFRAFAVAPALRGHVASVMAYREAFAAGHEVCERVLPDGAVRLAFNLGDAPGVGDDAGHAIEAIGASTAPALVRLRGRIDGLTVTLQPGAAAALLGLPAGEIAGGAVHLDDVWGRAGSVLLERLAAARDDAARAALVMAELERRLALAGAVAPPVAAHAARLIAASRGRMTVREVAATLGVGERRLQQLFQTQVGLSPRAWSRLARQRACLRALREAPAPRWADVAVDGGFYDQSHLVNEFRALCGMTPTEYLGSVAGSSNT